MDLIEYQQELLELLHDCFSVDTREWNYEPKINTIIDNIGSVRSERVNV